MGSFVLNKAMGRVISSAEQMSLFLHEGGDEDDNITCYDGSIGIDQRKERASQNS